MLTCPLIYHDVITPDIDIGHPPAVSLRSIENGVCDPFTSPFWRLSQY